MIVIDPLTISLIIGGAQLAGNFIGDWKSTQKNNELNGKIDAAGKQMMDYAKLLSGDDSYMAQLNKQLADSSNSLQAGANYQADKVARAVAARSGGFASTANNAAIGNAVGGVYSNLASEIQKDKLARLGMQAQNFQANSQNLIQLLRDYGNLYSQQPRSNFSPSFDFSWLAGLAKPTGGGS